MADSPLRVAVWCAVSSIGQAAEDKISLPEQEAAGRAFAQAVGGTVVRVYHVEHTREYLDYQLASAEMDAYAQLDEDCRRQVFDVLWTRSRDRLGRTMSLILATEGRVQRAGAEVFSAAMPHQIGKSTGDANNLMAALESWQAQRELSELRRRTRSGIRNRVHRGLAGTRWPYGYRPIRDSIGRSIGAEFDDRINAVRMATEMFLNGESYRAIQQALDQSPWKPPRSEQWSHAHVRRMLSCDTYAGIVRWGAASASDPSTKFPALWDEQTFRAVQIERQVRQEHARRKGEPSPLNGVAYCIRCGRAMNRYYYSWPRAERGLRCSTHSRTKDLKQSCHVNRILEQDVLDFLYEYLASLIDPQRFAEVLSAHQPGADLQRQLEDAKKRVADVEARRTRLGLGFASGVVKAEVYQLADAQLEDELNRVLGFLADLERQRQSQPTREERAASLRAVLDRLDALFGQPPSEVAATLRRIGLRVWVGEGVIQRVELV